MIPTIWLVQSSAFMITVTSWKFPECRKVNSVVLKDFDSNSGYPLFSKGDLMQTPLH